MDYYNKMATTASSLKSRAVKVLVNPVPRTLSDSLAILGHLRNFGEVTSFFSPLYSSFGAVRKPGTVNSCHTPKPNPESITYHAVFSSSTSAASAISNSMSQIKSGEDALDPYQDDPFDVRDLKSRVPTSKNTFTVHFKPDSEADEYHRAQINSNPFTSSFQTDPVHPITQSLLSLGVAHTSLASTLSTNCTPLNDPATESDPKHQYQSLRTLHHDAISKRARGELPPPPPPPSEEELRQNPKLLTSGQLGRLEAYRKAKMWKKGRRDGRFERAIETRKEAWETYADILEEHLVTGKNGNAWVGRARQA